MGLIDTDNVSDEPDIAGIERTPPRRPATEWSNGFFYVRDPKLFVWTGKSGYIQIQALSHGQFSDSITLITLVENTQYKGRNVDRCQTTDDFIIHLVLLTRMQKLDDVAEDGSIDGLEAKFAEVNGYRTRYYEKGSGETLILLHGGNWHMGINANTWSKNIDDLSKDYRVIAFDRVACGLTDNPEDVEDYIYQTELNHAIAFLNEMEIDSCHLVGSSRGAGLGTRIAVEHPDIVETLTIINSATLGPAAGDLDYRHDRLLRRHRPEELDPTDPDYFRLFYDMISYHTDLVSDDYCNTAAYLSSSPKARQTAQILDEQGHQEMWKKTLQDEMDEAHDRIKNGILNMPVLYMFGRNDLSVRLETGIAAFDMIAQENPNVRLKLFNNCGHLVYREYPVEFNHTLKSFIEFWARDQKET